MAVLHRLHARSRCPGAGSLARRAYGCLWLSPRLPRGHASSRSLESGSLICSNPPQIPRLKNPDSAPPVRVFRAYSAPIPRRPACSHGGRGPARSLVRAPPRRSLPLAACNLTHFVTVEGPAIGLSRATVPFLLLLLSRGVGVRRRAPFPPSGSKVLVKEYSFQVPPTGILG